MKRFLIGESSWRFITGDSCDCEKVGGRKMKVHGEEETIKLKLRKKTLFFYESIAHSMMVLYITVIVSPS